MVPLLDELDMFLGFEKVRQLIQYQTIQIAPLELIRGRNLHRTFMILDECQNATYEQLKMFSTRLGINSKCVLSGDLKQSDLQFNDLQDYINAIGVLEGYSHTTLDYCDIQRSGFVGRLLNRLENNK